MHHGKEGKAKVMIRGSKRKIKTKDSSKKTAAGQLWYFTVECSVFIWHLNVLSFVLSITFAV